MSSTRHEKRAAGAASFQEEPPTKKLKTDSPLSSPTTEPSIILPSHQHQPDIASQRSQQINNITNPPQQLPKNDITPPDQIKSYSWFSAKLDTDPKAFQEFVDSLDAEDKKAHIDSEGVWHTCFASLSEVQLEEARRQPWCSFAAVYPELKLEELEEEDH